jgi:molybdopterin converting factor small subunit
LSIKITLHKTHRQYTDGQETIEVTGNTVGQCFKDLVGRFPALEKELFSKKNTLKSNLEVYLNGESAYPNELKRPVKDGDHIHLTVMLAGG